MRAGFRELPPGAEPRRLVPKVLQDRWFGLRFELLATLPTL